MSSNSQKKEYSDQSPSAIALSSKKFLKEYLESGEEDIWGVNGMMSFALELINMEGPVVVDIGLFRHADGFVEKEQWEEEFPEASRDSDKITIEGDANNDNRITKKAVSKFLTEFENRNWPYNDRTYAFGGIRATGERRYKVCWDS